jgi:hypothetical protein
MKKQFFVNLVIDILATRTFFGDFINLLPQALRLKCRANLKSREIVITSYENGLKVYRRATAFEIMKQSKS